MYSPEYDERTMTSGEMWTYNLFHRDKNHTHEFIESVRTIRFEGFAEYDEIRTSGGGLYWMRHSRVEPFYKILCMRKPHRKA